MKYDELQQGIKENLPIPPREELWEAIEKGDLGKYTPEQIKQGMLQEDGSNRTLYHEAALKGHLDLIPKELLTEENLLQPDYDYWTCLHYAAGHGHLDQIPQELLTAENLLRPNLLDLTCFHIAAHYGQLDRIPTLSHQTLLHLKTDLRFKSDDEAKIRAFLEKQLRKVELQNSLRSCDHPSL